jgi:hypothetical protein
VVIGRIGADLREPVRCAGKQAPKGRHRARIGAPVRRDIGAARGLRALAPLRMQPNTLTRRLPSRPLALAGAQ